MNEVNRTLLDEVIKDRLEAVLDTEADAEGNNAAFRQAMEAIDRLNELNKIDASIEEQKTKQVTSKRESNIGMWIQIGGLVATAVVAPTIQYCCNKRYAKLLCNFEKDYTFTTTPGKAVSKFFNFRGKN